MPLQPKLVLTPILVSASLFVLSSSHQEANKLSNGTTTNNIPNATVSMGSSTVSLSSSPNLTTDDVTIYTATATTIIIIIINK